MSKICVIGSLNVDHIFYVDHLTKEGETQRAQAYELYYGGKGGNQAVACARLGLSVTMIGSIHQNDKGKDYIKFLESLNVNTQLIIPSELSTGMAFIEVDHNGENKITTWGGANYDLKVEWFKLHLKDILNHDIYMFSLEIPKEIIEFLMPILIEHKKKIILDPGPVDNLSEHMLYDHMILTPNVIEYEQIKTKFKYHDITVIEKKGAKGSTYNSGESKVSVDAFHVNPVDTVGAGDTFNAGIAYGFARGLAVNEMLEFANACGALATLKKGAQTGMPTLDEVKVFLNKVQD